MEAIEDLMMYARRQGVELWLKSGKLNYRFPKTQAEPPAFAHIRARKNEVIAFLQTFHTDFAQAPPLTKQDRGEQIPLSHAQERLWVVEQLGVSGAAYHMVSALRARGALDAGALERSVGRLVERHESLRTRFANVGGRAVQLIDERGEVQVQREDVSQLGEGAQAQALQIVQEQGRRAFDLTKGPLFRVVLVKVSAEEHVLLLMMHHIVSDGWSMGVLVQELSALYVAQLRGEEAALAELPIQYADYAIWQRQWLQGEVLAEQLQYWRQQLSGAPVALELPTDHERPAVASYRGGAVRFELSAALSSSLRELGQRRGVTLYMVLLASFQLLLSRYSGQRDVVVGSPIAGRGRRETEGLIGFFVNTLALRTDLSGDPSFEELLDRVKEVALGAYAHQELPFEKLVSEFKPPRDLSRQPIFQVMLALQNAPFERPQESAHLQLQGLSLELSAAKFDLSMNVLDTGAQLRGTLEYATDLFERASIERMAGCFELLLEQIGADASRRIGGLKLLREPQRQRLLRERNDTAMAFDQQRCVHEWIVQMAAQRPEAVALQDEGESLSYRQLDERSTQWAHFLRAQGVAAEQVVGVCLERSAELIVLLLGIFKAGGVYLPLDRSYPGAPLRYMLEDAGAMLLLTQRSLLEGVQPCAARALCVEEQLEEVRRQSRQALGPVARAQNLAYLIYTSGANGRPQAVGGTHRNALHRLAAQQRIAAFEAQDVGCQGSSLGLLDSLFEILCPLSAGAKLQVVSDAVAADPRQLLRGWEQAGVTRVLSVPSLATSMLEQDPQGVSRLQGLRSWTLSGEALSAALMRPLLEALPQCRFIHLFGATEVTADASGYPVQGGEPSIVPIGAALANTQLYVLDEQLEPLPLGVNGELFVGGEGVSRGYLHRAALTAQRFVPDPFGAPGSRLYRMGDWARYRADGQLAYRGREDQRVKIRGHRIELGEVEAAVRAHPQVHEAVVTLVTQKQAPQTLAAYLVGRDEVAVDTRALREFLGSRLPPYMIPSLYIDLPQLPRTPAGKVDRNALPAADPTLATVVEYLAARTPLEHSLVLLWQEVLKLERIGVHDNFFLLGGHSLLAMILIANIQQSLKINLTLRDLFESPTISRLAIQLSIADEDRKQKAEGLEPEEVGTI